MGTTWAELELQPSPQKRNSQSLLVFQLLPLLILDVLRRQFLFPSDQQEIYSIPFPADECLNVFPFPLGKKGFLLLFHSWPEQRVPQEVLEVGEGGRQRQEQDGLAKVTQQRQEQPGCHSCVIPSPSSSTGM